MDKLSKKHYIIIFIVLYFLTRIPRLHNDIVSTDAVYWHDRSEKFMRALNEKDYKETYQMYHPGVTLMWVTGITARVQSIVKNIPMEEIFADFVSIHYQAKLSLVFLQFSLSLLAIYLLSKIYDVKKAVLMVSLFTFEPFYIGNSRLLHLDAQISLYVLNGLLLSYLSIKDFKWWKPTLAGIFFALATLSKTLFIGSFLFGLFAGSFFILTRFKLLNFIKYFILIIVSATLTYLLLFPAFWHNGKTTLDIIMEDSLHVGRDAGHKQIFFGEITRNPGPLFYPTVFVLKLSLVTSLGFLVYLLIQPFDFVKKIRKKEYKLDIGNISFILFAGIFYLGYFGALMYFSKKIDRYFVPLIPFLSITAVAGYYSIKFKRKTTVLVVMVLFTIVYPLFKAFPHYLTYINPVIGDAGSGNKILGQKLFGIGVFDLRDFVVEKYGKGTKVSINDPGPLRSISGKTKVYNVFIEHPNSYTLMVLGPNKEFPPSIKKSGINLKHTQSIYINGLEFWRIFEKTSQTN